MGMARKLAAIIAADVVGYSRLMGVDEAETLAALKIHRRELIDPKIAEHQGRIVKTTGDGLLIEFPSVIEAVQCAVEVQSAMQDRNKHVPATRASSSASASISGTLSSTVMIFMAMASTLRHGSKPSPKPMGSALAES